MVRFSRGIETSLILHSSLCFWCCCDSPFLTCLRNTGLDYMRMTNMYPFYAVVCAAHCISMDIGSQVMELMEIWPEGHSCCIAGLMVRFTAGLWRCFVGHKSRMSLLDLFFLQEVGNVACVLNVLSFKTQCMFDLCSTKYCRSWWEFGVAMWGTRSATKILYPNTSILWTFTKDRVSF